MFEQDLLDEEIRKKKRRVLIGLLILFFLVALAALPRLPSPTLVAHGTATATRLPPPPASAVEATPHPTATSGVVGTTPARAEETPAGGGSGTLIATETPSGAGGSETPGTPPAGGVGGGTPGVTLPATTITEVKGTPGAGETPAGGVGGGTPGITGTTTASAGEEGQPGTGGPPVVVGGETPSATLPATIVAPIGTALAASTAVLSPGELPVTGATRPFVSGWLAIGLMLLLLGAGVAALHSITPGHRIR